MLTKLSKNYGVIGVVCFVLVTISITASADRLVLPGRALSSEEMATITGRGCSCTFSDKVCGFTCVSTYFDENCETAGDCVGIGWYANKCEVGFTNRYTCTGPGEDIPPCDNTAESIDCEGWSTCLFTYHSCNAAGKCYCSGVSLCGGIPYITECGQHASCQ